MAKQHNRRSGRNRGPQLSEGERLWKRMSNIFSDDETLFSKHWNAQTIAELLINGENMAGTVSYTHLTLPTILLV